MDTNDVLLRWSHMTLDQIENEILTGKDRDSITQLLGGQTVAELSATSFAPPPRNVPDPVVLLPGIMGSELSSVRGVTSLVWINPLIFVQGRARYLSLNADWTVDGCPEVEMTPVGLVKLYYIKMELALNHSSELYEFPYDWRRPVEYNADVLHASLERWAAGSDRKFNLVAHSMGGLVSRSYMARHPADAEKRVRQLVMLGTPNFGAANAVTTLFMGNDMIGTVDGLNQANDMVGVVRNLPGVYNLLPAPPEFLPSGRAYPVDWEVYNAAAWQLPSISQDLLNSTHALHLELAHSDPQIPLTMIAGCNLSTVVQVGFNAGGGAAPALLPVKVSEGANSGDTTVPLWSSLLPGAQTYYIQEKHTNLPNNNDVIAAVQALLQGGAPKLPETLPPPRNILGISFDAPAVPPTPEELAQKIRAGTAGKNDLDALHFAL